jgi:hypothetical protein
MPLSKLLIRIVIYNTDWNGLRYIYDVQEWPAITRKLLNNMPLVSMRAPFGEAFVYVVEDDGLRAKDMAKFEVFEGFAQNKRKAEPCINIEGQTVALSDLAKWEN